MDNNRIYMRAEYITISFLFLGLILIFMQKHINSEKKKLNDIRLKIDRNKQVLAFRIRMIYLFNITEDKMPTYVDMLDSDKTLEAKYWIDVDKLVNLN